MLSAAASIVPLVRLMAMISATTAVPMKLPIHTQVQLRKVPLQLHFPAQVAMGSKAKFPVTSSMPNSTMLAKPNGKSREPTKGSLVRIPTVSARITAKPRMAPE